MKVVVRPKADIFHQAFPNLVLEGVEVQYKD